MLAYSGGLDTSVALRWLAEEYGAEVVALLVDVGQGIDREAVTRRAMAAGAADVVIADAREEFAAASSCSRSSRPAPSTRAAIRSSPRSRAR